MGRPTITGHATAIEALRTLQSSKSPATKGHLSPTDGEKRTHKVRTLCQINTYQENLLTNPCCSRRRRSGRVGVFTTVPLEAHSSLVGRTYALFGKQKQKTESNIIRQSERGRPLCRCGHPATHSCRSVSKPSARRWLHCYGVSTLGRSHIFPKLKKGPDRTTRHQGQPSIVHIRAPQKKQKKSTPVSQAIAATTTSTTVTETFLME